MSQRSIDPRLTSPQVSGIDHSLSFYDLANGFRYIPLLIMLRVMRRVAAKRYLCSAGMRKVSVAAFTTTVLEARFSEDANQISNLLRHGAIVLL